MSAEETASRLHGSGVVTPFRENFRCIVLSPARVAGGVHQYQVREALRIAECILEGYVAAKGMAEDRPPVEAQCLAQGVCIGGQVLERHG